MLGMKSIVGSFWKLSCGYSEVADNGGSYPQRKASGIVYSNAFLAGASEVFGVGY